MQLIWKTDNDAVACITRLGLAWEMASIPAKAIDVPSSRRNHARSVPIISGNVDDYADAMAAGDVFPTIVAARIGTNKDYVIAGGNHRLAAALRLGVTEFNAIVVTCQEREFFLLCPALNMYVGQREDRGQRARHAAHAVERLGISVKQAAEDYKVPASSVSNYVTDMRIVVAATRSGLRVDHLPPAALRQLGPYLNDAVLLPLGVELVRTRISPDEVRAILKSVRGLPNEIARVQSLKQHIESAKQITVGGRVTKQPIRSAINRSVTILTHHITEKVTPCAIQMTEQETAKLSDTLRRLWTILNGIHHIHG